MCYNTFMNFDEYRAINAINFSSLKSMKKSPKQFKYDLENGIVDSVGKSLGRATHTATLEPDKFNEEYAIYTGKIRKGKDWERFKSENPRKTILKEDEAEHCLRIAREVRLNPIANKYLTGGKPEHTIQWTDSGSGQRCKARLDYLNDIDGKIYIVDLKGCQTVLLQNFRVEAGKNSYHRQLGYYKSGISQLYPGREIECIIIGVEHKQPHDVCVYRMEEDSLIAGQEDCLGWLKLVAECVKSNTWNGCYGSEQELVIRKWELEIPDDTIEDIGLEFDEG